MSQVEASMDDLLHSLANKHDFSLEDENFSNTPERVMRAYEELLSGYKQDPEKILNASFPSDDYDQMVVCSGIDFYSLCSHHMLPFFGTIAIAYIPGENGRVVGLSKLARIAQMYAKRFQIQERLSQQIANALNDNLNPSGVGVVITAEHLCMKMRGVKQHSSVMTTSCLLGEFRGDPAVRNEFLKLLGMK